MIPGVTDISKQLEMCLNLGGWFILNKSNWESSDCRLNLKKYVFKESKRSYLLVHLSNVIGSWESWGPEIQFISPMYVAGRNLIT